MMLARDKFQGEKNESKINIELGERFFPSRIRVNPTRSRDLSKGWKDFWELAMLILEEKHWKQSAKVPGRGQCESCREGKAADVAGEK